MSSNYTTLADLLQRDSERDLMNLTGNGLIVDAGAVAASIAIAQGLIDSYISERVTLPLSQVEVDASAQLKAAALVITRWYLYADKKTDAVQLEYDAAIRWLKDVSMGKATLGIIRPLDPLATTTTGNGIIVAPVARPRFGPVFESLYDVPMGHNGFGAFNSGGRNY